jgi:hypothetical protein
MTDIPPPNSERDPSELGGMDRIDPNDTDRPRSPLGFDELIALFVAFVTIGTIFFWVLSRRSTPGLPSFLPALTSPSAAPAPTIAPTDPAAVVPISPSPIVEAPTPAPQPTVQPNQPAPLIAVPVPQPSVVASPPASPAPQTEFPDVPPNFWATPFITELARRGIVDGFPDRTFRPEQPVTRAQFAVMLEKAFPSGETAQSAAFSDVPANYWGTNAIAQAVQSGFMRGYPDNQFRPEQQIPKEQAIIALTTGLKIPIPESPDQTVSLYRDANRISPYAVGPIAAATRSSLVANYPDPTFLEPQLTTSRAEAAALIYQALVQRNQVAPIQSQFIVQSPQ